jgi:protein TonB
MRIAVMGLLLCVAMPAAAQAPAPDQVEVLTWQGTVNANSAGAYRLYLDRYPNGAFAGLARENLARLGAGAVAVPVPPPLPAAAPPPPPPPICATAIMTADAPAVGIDPRELAAYREASTAHRFARWRGFLAAFPGGTCAPEVNYFMMSRIARYQAYVATPAEGARAAAWSGAGAGAIVTQDDYPPAALRAGEQGAVAVSLEIAEDGRVDDCVVSGPSGSAALDATTCRLFMRRARFSPARDAAGLPIVSTRSQRINWQLPVDPPKK